LLTYGLLREKFLEAGLLAREIFFKIVHFLEKENKGGDCAIGVYQKIN
jgi:hypothetical protein